MDVAAGVGDPEHPHLALVNHEHRHVGVHVAVDGPPHPGPAVQQPGAAVDVVAVGPVGMCGVEADVRGFTVGEHVHLLGRRGFGGHWVRADHKRSAAALHPRGRGDFEIRPATSRYLHGLVGHQLWLVDVIPVYCSYPERAARDPYRDRPVVGVDDTHSHDVAGGSRDPGLTRAVDGPHPGVGVQLREHGLHIVVTHDQCTEQAAHDLLVPQLVRVVPVRPHLIGHEPVHEVLAGADRVLGNTRDAIHRVGHIHAVPVQSHAVCDVVVVHPHLDQLPLHRFDGRPRAHPIQGVAVDDPAVSQCHRPLARDQLDPHIGGTVWVGDEVRDTDGVRGVLVRDETAGVHNAHGHDAVRARQPARPPHADQGRNDHRAHGRRGVPAPPHPVSATTVCSSRMSMTASAPASLPAYTALPNSSRALRPCRKPSVAIPNSP